MPIKFISLNEKFADLMKTYYETHLMKIQDYHPTRRTYYVSPANSLCFMDGGIDYTLSRIIFPGIEPRLKAIVDKLNITTLLERKYLPIGSSVVIDYDAKRSMIAAPTMLLPQNVAKTKNAYYATMAILHNILVNRHEDINKIDILMTSLCCGVGKMDEQESANQIIKGINDFSSYNPKIMNKDIIINEPNLFEQPLYYQNTEWFAIPPQNIMNS